MYKIKLRGPAGEIRIDPNWDKVDNDFDKSILDGIDCQECFTDYLWEEEHGSLIKKGISHGYMNFSYDRKEDRLYVEVDYKSKLELTPRDLEILIRYTQGQMSDGIGENFEQEPVRYTDDGKGIYISPWFRGQKLVATQTLLVKKFGEET